MTNLLVLGGSGRTGIYVLTCATSRGHRVRALVRNPDAVQVPPDVTLVEGTPTNIDDLRKAAQGTEAVISVLNNARTSHNPWAGPISPRSHCATSAAATHPIHRTLTPNREREDLSKPGPYRLTVPLLGLHRSRQQIRVWSRRRVRSVTATTMR
ncbi:NAD(P)H-binding protein [Mycobacterium shigaense]|uniref:NAD(P)H-binding protein n=1 Tax=Mycobacterium shigaense TaxID=722731 RepID=UPI002AE06498|nr:NAD(P)H-binding protein [Mycobacterium shigaense]MEA1121405.1 NAD(P)H-binding protein [Mycobacterium shigaense]